MNIIRHTPRRVRTAPLDPFGVCYHTSGRTIVQRALQRNQDPLERMLWWYGKKGGPHAVLDLDGTLHQLQRWDVKGAHVGVSWLQRRAYLHPSWADKAQRKYPQAYRLWDERWPWFDSPQHLYPTRGPNGSYIGIEMRPLLTPTLCGLWFTDAQHRTAREFYEYCNFPDDRPNRLVGHEDLSTTRWQSVGGWDPGAMRRRPRFDWTKVRP